MFLDKILKAVEILSISFQELEEEVLKQYENIKNQIITKVTLFFNSGNKQKKIQGILLQYGFQRRRRP